MTNCADTAGFSCRSRSRRLRNVSLIALVVAALVSIGAMATLGTKNATAQQHNTTTTAATATSGPRSAANGPALDYATGLSKAFRNAAEDVLPSVVTIQRTAASEPQANSRSKQPPGNMFEDPFLRRFFGENPNMPRIPFPEIPHGPEMSMGSGVIIDSSGVILTNNHVVAGGGRIMVRLHDGREFEASQVNTDARTDLAVVRIKDAGPLPAARLGDSDKLQVGDWVIAVGNPFGLEETVTAGIISAKGRGIGITAREEYLQTDAAINPGNSGGPLVSLQGEVVGINTAISSRTGGYEGVGFAIPIDLAKWVSNQLIAHGSVTRAYLGVGIQQVTPELASQFGLKETTGTVVTEVRPNSPAADAGVKTGDVVIKFAGHAIHNPHEIQAFVEQTPVNSKQPLVIVRDGKQMTLDVTVRQQPKDYGLAGNESPNRGESGATEFKELGIEVSNLTPELADQLGVKDTEGIVITSVDNGSLAELAGLQPPMVIERVGQTPVHNVKEFRAAMKTQSLTKGVLLLVHSEDGSRFVIIKNPH